jgi:hypothetical protein
VRQSFKSGSGRGGDLNPGWRGGWAQAKLMGLSIVLAFVVI